MSDGDPEVIVVSIDVDPNESIEQVVARAEEHASIPGSRWSISPKEFTDTLVAEFGPSIINPPSAPFIVINADQTDAYLMKDGKKSAEEILSAIADAAGE